MSEKEGINKKSSRYKNDSGEETGHLSVKVKDGVVEDGVVETSNFTKFSLFGVRVYSV